MSSLHIKLSHCLFQGNVNALHRLLIENPELSFEWTQHLFFSAIQWRRNKFVAVVSGEENVRTNGDDGDDNDNGGSDLSCQMARLILEHAAAGALVGQDRQIDRLVNSIGAGTRATPLVAAVNAKHEGLVKLLLEHGAIPQESRESSRGGQGSCVGSLRNSDIRFPSYLVRRKSMTPLMHAARKGLVAITKLMLEAMTTENRTIEVEPSEIAFCPIADVYDEQAKNALMHACSEGHAGVARLLIDHAVMWRMKQEWISQERQKQTAAKVVNAYKVDTALWYACGGGHVEVVQLLLEQGALPEYRADGTIYSSTPLMEAAEWGHVEVVALLLKQDGTDPRSATGRKALRLAQQPGYTSVVSEMQRWSQRLDGLEGLLCSKKKMKPKPGLVPAILVMTEDRHTLLFHLVREHADMILTRTHKLHL